MSDIHSYIWKWGENNQSLPNSHYDRMQEVIPENIVSGKEGLEIGCGSGVDAITMAVKNKKTHITAIDINIDVAKRMVEKLKVNNVSIFKASALSLPFENNRFDFCYSFGVIHHTADPMKCFQEINRVLKNDSKVYLYLYEEHGGIKKYLLKPVDILRKITVKMNKNILSVLCLLISPLIFVVFTLPARMFKALNLKIANSIPFNFANHPLSPRWNLFDRLASPIEYRYSEESISRSLKLAGFKNISFARFKDLAGLIVWATK